MKLSANQLRNLKAFARVTAELASQQHGLSRSRETCFEYRQRQHARKQQLEKYLANVQYDPESPYAARHPNRKGAEAALAELAELEGGLADNDVELAAIRQRMAELAVYLGPRNGVINAVLSRANMSGADLGIARGM